MDEDLYEETLETSWEIEARALRLERKLFQQSDLIQKMKSMIKSYDDDFANLVAERHALFIHVVLLDLHILALQQELLVLTKFESHEDKLSNAVNTNMLELMNAQDTLVGINSKVEAHKAAIDILSEKEKQIQGQFYSSIVDNKFYDFLRKIFKKKYKPPREHDPDGNLIQTTIRNIFYFVLLQRVTPSHQVLLVRTNPKKKTQPASILEILVLLN